MHIDTSALQASLDRLRAAPAEPDLVGALRRVIGAMDLLFDHDGAGIMFVDDEDELRYVAASDQTGRQLEAAQLLTGQGPCVDTYLHRRIVTSKDVHSDARWPQLSAHVDPSVRAVAGAPIVLGGAAIGTLNVYRSHSYAWDDSDQAALTAYAALIGEVLTSALAARDNSVLAGQLQYALDYRVVIERAIGYLMGRHDLDPTTAFNLLRKQARDSRRRVAEVAAHLVGDPTTPTPSPPPTQGLRP